MAKPKGRRQTYPAKIKDRTRKLDKKKKHMPVHGKDFGRMVRDAQAKRLKKIKGKIKHKGGVRR